MPELKQPLGLKPLWGKIASLFVNSSGDDVEALAENDGTQRVQLVGWDGAQERVGVETTSELKVSNYGKAAGTATAVKVESTGEQDIVLHGKDSGANIDPLRTNASQQLQVEVVGSLGTGRVGLTLGVLNPSAATETVLYTVPASTTTRVSKMWVVNRSTTAATTVRIGFSLFGGALGAADYIYHDHSVAASTTLLIDGDFWLGATDEIRVYTANATASFGACGEEFS